jgi:hypothetical protein
MKLPKFGQTCGLLCLPSKNLLQIVLLIVLAGAEVKDTSRPPQKLFTTDFPAESKKKKNYRF